MTWLFLTLEVNLTVFCKINIQVHGRQATSSCVLLKTKEFGRNWKDQKSANICDLLKQTHGSKCNCQFLCYQRCSSLSAITYYLNDVHGVFMPPSQFWYCTSANYFLFSAALSSTYIIISMTFDRFYSIIKPHRAASMNTVKRAYITISCVISLSFVFNIPHWFLSTALDNKFCQPFYLHLDKWYNGAYFWLSMVLSYAIPFICLLIMNSCVIYAINKSVKNANAFKGIGKSKSECFTLSEEESIRPQETDTKKTTQKQTKEKCSEVQIYFTLLSVTFAFLILTFPTYAYFFYARVYGASSDIPKYSALLYFLAQFSHKMFYTNNGINFFLYVMSGGKFRRDVLKLCHCSGRKDGTVSSGTRVTEFSSSSVMSQPWTFSTPRLWRKCVPNWQHFLRNVHNSEDRVMMCVVQIDHFSQSTWRFFVLTSRLKWCS